MESRRNFEFDVDLYTHAEGLFAAKRAKLRPEAVICLARDVISRLAIVKSAPDGQPHPRAPGLVYPDLVESFCAVLLEEDASMCLRFFEDQLVPIVEQRADLYDYISEASRKLGEKWDEDEVSFLQVTIAAGKLYALVRSVAAREPRAPVAGRSIQCALFASVPGEQHTLGVTIAAEVFRTAGWDIDLLISRSHDELLERACMTHPPVVGLSVSNSAGLDTLARLVVALRLASPDTIIAVAAGPDINHDVLCAMVDLDLVITDARSAQVKLARMLQRRWAAA